MKPTTEIPEWFEEHERELVEEHVPAGSVVLEAGAGMGAVTRELTKKGGMVIACEPQSEPFKYLRLNAPDALHVPCAVSWNGEPVKLSFYDSFWAANQWQFSARGKPDDVSFVPTVSYEGLRKTFRPSVFVVDIEGGEAPIFHLGGFEGISLIIAEVHPDYCDKDLLDRGLDRLHREGFELVHRRDVIEDTYHAVFQRSL